MATHSTTSMESDWQEFMKEGDAYLRSAQGGQKRAKVFTPPILYNLLSMAIEKHVMASLLFHGRLAQNHTLSDLVEAAAQVRPFDDELATQLRDFEKYQDLCAFSGGSTAERFPAERVPEFLGAAEAVQSWAQAIVSQKAPEVLA